MLDALFRRHPRSVGLTYLQHARRALGMAVELLGVSCKLVVHAAVPALFETSASDMVRRRYAELLKETGAPRTPPTAAASGR